MITVQSNRPAPRVPSSASVAVPLTLIVSPTDQHGGSGSAHGAGASITGTGAALSASIVERHRVGEAAGAVDPQLDLVLTGGVDLPVDLLARVRRSCRRCRSPSPSRRWRSRDRARSTSTRRGGWRSAPGRRSGSAVARAIGALTYFTRTDATAVVIDVVQVAAGPRHEVHGVGDPAGDLLDLAGVRDAAGLRQDRPEAVARVVDEEQRAVVLARVVDRGSRRALVEREARDRRGLVRAAREARALGRQGADVGVRVQRARRALARRGWRTCRCRRPRTPAGCTAPS